MFFTREENIVWLREAIMDINHEAHAAAVGFAERLGELGFGVYDDAARAYLPHAIDGFDHATAVLRPPPVA
jgi:hypothetical protein